MSLAVDVFAPVLARVLGVLIPEVQGAVPKARQGSHPCPSSLSLQSGTQLLKDVDDRPLQPEAQGKMLGVSLKGGEEVPGKGG